MNRSRRTMGDLKRAPVALCGGVLAVMAAVHAQASVDDRRREPRASSVPRVDSSRIATVPSVHESMLRVRRVRLEPAPPPARQRAVTLKFDLVNDGSATVSNV